MNLNPFRQPSAEELAQRQLAEARLALLEHQRLAEYHQAIVSMLEARIERLEGSQGHTYVHILGDRS